MTLTPNDPRLLTPGPLTTSHETKEAMLHDWGSRDQNFIEMNARVRERLLAIANANDTHVCVLLQGSGTFVVEASLCTLIPQHGKALILVNGAYGHRMCQMLNYAERKYLVQETPEDQPPSIEALENQLKEDPDISHVLVVHCETTSGILNPIEDIAKIVKAHDRSLIIDAMSAFGAIEVDAKKLQFDAIMASSNKCLEGVPGVGFSLIRQSSLENCNNNAHSLSLDLYDQWLTMRNTNQWRFTPPTHVIAALEMAINQFNAEGGVTGRYARYSENCRVLTEGMKDLGFAPLLPNHLQAPIIVTFKMPQDPAFDFQIFYDQMKKQGYVLYPGKLTVAPSFRVGCIGHLDKKEILNCISKMKIILENMGFKSVAENKTV